MDTLRILPVIQNFLEGGHFDKAISIIKEYMEVLAPYIQFSFPGADAFEPESALVLCKLFLLRKDYPRAIEFGMRAKALLHTMNSFYFEAFVFRTMDELLSSSRDHAGSMSNSENNTIDNNTMDNSSTKNINSSPIREFVLEYIKNDPSTDSLLGYLACIKEFAILEQRIVELSQLPLSAGGVDCKDILVILEELAPAELVGILSRCSMQNDSFFENILDSLVALKMHEKIRDLVYAMPWDKMYAACFYLEDTHRYVLCASSNPDASFIAGASDTPTDNTPNNSSTHNSSTNNSSTVVDNANFILSGQWKQEILSNFLFKNNKTNFKFLEAMSKARAPYMALANSFMNAGTTNDSLYRNNKSLIGGKDWTRFVEFASLGMIHQGNFDPFEILKELLPSLESSSGEPGALMALGIMNAGRNDEDANEYYMNWLTSNSEEIVFGSCVGLGLNAMESGDRTLLEKLKVLFATDSTITQESALYGVGLVFAGTECQEVVDFVRSIHDNTDFPRVKRVCGLATALINCMGEGRTDLLAYLDSESASIRSMGLLSLGTAYAATSNLDIIDKVLAYVDDRDDETKRSAVIAIALIGYGDQEIKNSCIIPMAENHNPFVRATAAICLGFFNSGMCDTEVCGILEAMLYDSEELVKQNACMGIGFAFMQGNPSTIPNYKRTLDRMNLMIVSRSESQCAKIGASIGRAISEASGKSSIYSLRNYNGQVVSSKVIGAMMFLYSWYWYPLIPCVALCLHPTPIFFFDQNLDETSDSIPNSETGYDYLVRLPEIKKSRKFRKSGGKENKEGGVSNKDILEPPKSSLKSGDKLTYKERMDKELGSGIVFKDKKL